jgi:hypothetical protein
MLVVAFRGIPDVRTTETVNEGELLAAEAQRRTAAARAEGGGGDDDDNGRRNGRGGAGEGGDPPPGPSDDGAGSPPPPPVVIKVLWIPEAPEPYNLNASEVGKDSRIFANITVPSREGRLLFSYTKLYTPERTDNGAIPFNKACIQSLEDAELMAGRIDGAQVFALKSIEPPHQPQMVVALPTDETGVIIRSDAVDCWQPTMEQLTFHQPIIWVPKLDTIWKPQEFGSMLRECDRDGFPEYFERFTKEPEEPEEEGVVFHTPCYSVTEAIQHVLAAAAQKR